MLRLFPRREPEPAPPRILPRRAGALRCWCCCHADEDSGPVSISGTCTPGVERTDVLGAAAACPVCLRWHCPALAGRPPELDPTRRPYSPPPLVAVDPVAQADGGTTDDGN